ncbi:MAG TPA: hypothetical protein PLX35_15990 [Cyclobacteriaceae bacterium]|nr:hypothetical protein [Cyclobacteriaceae bacterium]
MGDRAAVAVTAPIWSEGYLIITMPYRIPFVLLAVVNLLIGMWAGLLRAGWHLPGSTIAVHHGAILVGGFLTTLIALEKVIPLRKNWMLVIPVISAGSLIVTLDSPYGLYCMIAGAAGLLMVLAYYAYLHPKDLAAVLMMAGAGCLLIGDVLLLRRQFYPMAFPWWMAFLLLTITAERLELSKFLPVTNLHKAILVALLSLFVLGLVFSFHGAGNILSGSAAIGVSLWMLRHDVIGIGLKKEGLVRFSAVALVIANVWLMIEGALLLLSPQTALAYDMAVHVFFLGYTFAMIFAHGPIILPGVLGIQVRPYHPILYAWLFITQGSLLFRVMMDGFENPSGRYWSGIVSGIGILLYFLTIVFLSVPGKVAHQRP